MSQKTRGLLFKEKNQLTGYLAHVSVVFAAVSGFLTVAIAVAHNFSPCIFKTFVVSAGAAMLVLPLTAAGFSNQDELTAQKHQIPANDEPHAPCAPPVRSHGVCCSGATCSVLALKKVLL